MRVRIAKAALLLYPFAWRRRYSEEMHVLFEESQPSIKDLFDLLIGAIRAHAQPASSTYASLRPSDRLGASVNGILACWVVFGLAAFALILAANDDALKQVVEQHFLLSASLKAVEVLLALAIGTSLTAALSAAMYVGVRMQLRQASGRVAPLPGGLAALAAMPIALLVLNGPGASNLWLRVLIDLALGGVAIATTLLLGRFIAREDERFKRFEVSAYEFRKGKRRSLEPEVVATEEDGPHGMGDDMFYVAWPAAALGAVAMGLAAIATAVFLATLLQHSGEVSGFFSSPVWVGILLAVMTATGAFAARTAKRGWQTFRSDSNPVVALRKAVAAAEEALAAKKEESLSA
jgi:hypothetical protein